MLSVSEHTVLTYQCIQERKKKAFLILKLTRVNRSRGTLGLALNLNIITSEGVALVLWSPLSQVLNLLHKIIYLIKLR